MDGVAELGAHPKAASEDKGTHMSPQAHEVLAQALKLSPLEKAELVERILDTFVLPDRKAIDERWAAEAEDRIDAYDRGEVAARSVMDVFARIERSDA